jgi:hypothetical protein
MEHDATLPERHVPVVGLMKVVVKTDEAPCLSVATVRLDHLASLREPFATIRLDEETALVAVHGRLDDVDALDDLGRGDDCH